MRFRQKHKDEKDCKDEKDKKAGCFAVTAYPFCPLRPCRPFCPFLLKGTLMDPRSHLPSVDEVLQHPLSQILITEFTRLFTLDAVRSALAEFRIKVTNATAPSVEEIALRARTLLKAEFVQRLRPVVNATGVVLHTNLGRSVLPPSVAQKLGQMDRCCNLQVDLETGERGKRNYMTEKLICRLTGAEAALLVTNNAAATFLILSALCAGKEVVISRGQLIEIGGAFRLPDCIAQSGATMVEVGTTNKTHLRDYSAALTERTGLLLRCNPSNYRMTGFTKSVSIGEMVSLKKERPDLTVVDDLGCGALIDLSQYGLPKEPTVQESIAAGADLCCFSGDKLIGGSQAGIIVGRADLIKKLKKHPLSRMLRVDKLIDLSLEHTLRLFLEPEKLAETHPTFRMLTIPADALKEQAERLKEQIETSGSALQLSVCPGESAVGGGSLPGVAIPTWLLCVRSSTQNADALCKSLRLHEPPIITRIEDNSVVFDMRTLLPGEDAIVRDALNAV
ncbi:TPA: L-seryl-tRNA(Sec) selenium transferase [Candidatus Sumerlaeota bacterium]|nr:L-seryl-tRNA(Sec) selenium transferase [Candidatus Sumerlaeota bacterium]